MSVNPATKDTNDGLENLSRRKFLIISAAATASEGVEAQGFFGNLLRKDTINTQIDLLTYLRKNEFLNKDYNSLAIDTIEAKLSALKSKYKVAPQIMVTFGYGGCGDQCPPLFINTGQVINKALQTTPPIPVLHIIVDTKGDDIGLLENLVKGPSGLNPKEFDETHVFISGSNKIAKSGEFVAEKKAKELQNALGHKVVPDSGVQLFQAHSDTLNIFPPNGNKIKVLNSQIDSKTGNPIRSNQQVIQEASDALNGRARGTGR